MKYSGNTVSNRCATESVAETTMRRGPLRRSMKGELAGAELTTITRLGKPRSSPDHSPRSMSGPTRLNFASTPSNVPWPIRKTNSMSSAFACPRSVARARRTLAAVAACAGSGDSDRLTMRDGSNFRRSTSAIVNVLVQAVYCCA